MSVAAEAVEGLRAAGATVATAESLTGGLVCATLVSVPGASTVVRGGVIAYAAELKTQLLGVDAELISRVGTVDAAVASSMALGVRERLGATYGLATTGVAGPGPSEGKPAGTVHVGVAGPGGVETALLHLDGDRETIRTGTVAALLSLLVARLGEESRSDRG
ncbi:nicotinamide-nucleotide amidohydrolase family protein [Aeromicrobium sp. SMF47]|uniref:CinA family protein n=1 Tax=Aeromicrobium TaxID=2040 RepID=UPI0013BF0633|nr:MULTISPECIES: CinA family protein [Aeromicrobium]MRJ76973.1 nicotinamide-nucleotide amidohydrolase family protein [Aeromicrobium yanjiei]MRK01317.1 nicotinamide-nucleotide amidohydrolase family protein [Aeromicrobium sp. S22]